MANINAQNKHLVFLGIAKKDLKASKCLYENKFYPQAIFYLQQSAEKAVKSLILWLEEVSEKDLKTHNARKLLLEMIIIPMANILEENREWLIRILRQRRFIRKLERNPKLKYLYLKLLKSSKLLELPSVRYPLRHGIIKITGLLESFSFRQSVDKIQKFDEAIRKYGWHLPREFYNKTINFIDEINRFEYRLIKLLEQSESELLLKVGELLEAEDEELDEELLEVSKKFALFIELTPVFGTIYSLYLLLLLLSEHYNTITRYPIDGLNPLEIFDDKSPLVQKLKEYMEITERILRELGSIYREQSPELMDTLRQLIEKGGT